MRGKPYHFSDLSGGVNLKDAVYLLDTKQARDLLNVVSTSRGAITLRNGSSAFWPAIYNFGNPLVIADLFAHEAGTDPILIASATDEAASITNLKALRADATVLATGPNDVYDATNPASWEWISAPANGGQGPAFGMNGAVARYFDGTAFGTWTASSGTLPVGKYLQFAENRVIVAGTTTSPSTVYGSDIGNPRDWDTSDNGSWANQFDPSDGQVITGLGSIGPDILAFKRSKAFLLYDLTTGAYRRISASVGCASHRSIAETPYGTFFLAEDGVWKTDGQTVKRISYNVDPLLQKIVPARRSRAAGVWFNDRYYLSICTTGTSNNLTLEYDPMTESWWIHTLAGGDWAAWRRTSGQPAQLYLANGTFGVVRAFDSAVKQDWWGDGFVPYLGFWKSDWHSFGDPYLRKRMRMAHFDGAGKVGVYAAKDFQPGDTQIGLLDFAAISGTFGGAGTFGGSGVWGDSAQVAEGRALNPGVGRVWSLTLSSTSDFTVDSYTLLMTERKD